MIVLINNYSIDNFNKFFLAMLEEWFGYVKEKKDELG